MGGEATGLLPLATRAVFDLLPPPVLALDRSSRLHLSGSLRSLCLLRLRCSNLSLHFLLAEYTFYPFPSEEACPHASYTFCWRVTWMIWCLHAENCAIVYGAELPLCGRNLLVLHCVSHILLELL